MVKEFQIERFVATIPWGILFPTFLHISLISQKNSYDFTLQSTYTNQYLETSKLEPMSPLWQNLNILLSLVLYQNCIKCREFNIILYNSIFSIFSIIFWTLQRTIVIFKGPTSKYQAEIEQVHQQNHYIQDVKNWRLSPYFFREHKRKHPQGS